MKKTVRLISISFSLIFSCALFYGCNDKKVSCAERIGEPVLIHSEPEFDEATQTFNLILKADSVNGAILVFSLIEGDSVIMRNEDGRFDGIAPFDEGYDVKLEAQWSDTIIERICHIMDFVVPAEIIEKISLEDFARLINAKDRSLRSSINEHLAQSISFHVIDSKMQPQMLSDAIVLIDTGVWQAVEIVKLEYNENNLITDIIVRPIGEQVDCIDLDDEDFDY